MMHHRRETGRGRALIVWLAAAAALAFYGCSGNDEKVQRKLVREEIKSSPRPDQEHVALKKTSGAGARPTRPSGTPPPKGFFVTTHTLARVDARRQADYRIEGNELANCRIYLRRYGAETELVPTKKANDVIEFRGAEWYFLERGAYDLVLRDGSGREWNFPGAVVVTDSPVTQVQ